MAPFFSLVKDINSSTKLFVMKVRLVRSYEVTAFGNKTEFSSFEYVFEDKEGDRIHASVRGQAMKMFKGKAVEDHIYALKDFIVTENRMKYKTTTHPMRIIFWCKTKMEEIFDAKFPATVYQFKTFTEVQEAKEKWQFVLFDIIGRVVSCELPPVTTAKGKRMEFTLEDLEKKMVKCTLWDEYIDKLLPYVENESEECVIVLIEFGRVSVFGDQVRYCNTYNVTKITVNGDSDAFEDFYKSLADSGMESCAITILPSCSAPTVADAFKNMEAEVKNLAEIVRCENDGYFWVSATIVHIETLREWCYLSCDKCSKKLKKESGGFFCVKCNVKDSRGHYRYKIEVLMHDGSEAAKFMLWDNECAELIGNTAGDVMKSNPEAFDFVPTEIQEALTDRVGLFKVHVKAVEQNRYSVTYNVTKLTADSRILNMYYENYVDKKDARQTLCIEDVPTIEPATDEGGEKSELEKGYDADDESEDEEDDNGPINKLVKGEKGDCRSAKKKKKTMKTK